MGTERNGGVTADPLFLGVTRPAMAFGVTYSALLANAVVTVELFLLTRNLLWLLACIPVHGLFWLLCLSEPRFFDLALLWGKTRGPGLFGNRSVWRAQGYSPLALDLPGKSGKRRAMPVVRDVTVNAAAVPFERARRELVAARHVPYTALVAPEVVRTLSGDYVQTIRIGGIAFESADDEAVNAWHERLNALWRNVASAHVALWVHIVRRRDRAYPAGEFPPGFARELNERYRARLAGETLMVNELYVSLVYRPQPTAVGSAALKLFGRAESDTARAELAESLEACEKLRSQVLAGLAAYEPEVLGLRAGEGAESSAVGAARVPGPSRQWRAPGVGLADGAGGGRARHVATAVRDRGDGVPHAQRDRGSRRSSASRSTRRPPHPVF